MVGQSTSFFNPVNIKGLTGLSLSGLFGAGNIDAFERGAGSTGDYIQVRYQIDGGKPKNLFCFGGEANKGPLGLDANCDGFADNTNGTGRLVPDMAEYSFDIPETGNGLAVSIRVNVPQSGEEIAFDDIKLTGILPEPDNHPTAFTATSSGTDRIDLSWSKAAGTKYKAPTGYVIYASETNQFYGLFQTVARRESIGIYRTAVQL